MLTTSFVLLVFVCFVTLASIICHAALGPVLRTLAHAAPGPRAHALMLVAAAPWLIGGSVLLSSIADILFGACDLGSACLWNEDPTDIEPLRMLIALPLLTSTLAAVSHLAPRWLRSRRIIATLDRASREGDDSHIRVVPSESALALAGNGRIYVSQAVRDRLTPDQYRAVLLHEQAHLQRRDRLFQIVAGVLAACYLPAWRKRLLDAIALANEQACDERASASVGRETTAAAILAVERMRSGVPGALLPGFTDGFVAARVRRLIDPERPRWNVGMLRTSIVLAILFAYLGADMLYYVTMLILYPVAL